MIGRPTTYSPSVLKKAQEYINSCIDTDVEENTEETQEPQSHGGSLQRKRKAIVKVKLPTRGGLAKYLGVHRDTLYEWASKYDDFSDIMEQLGSEQEDRLINMGLSGAYNPTIAKVLLTKHGYNDTIENKGEQKFIIETRKGGKK